MSEGDLHKDSQAGSRQPAARPVIDSGELLARNGELAIAHGGEIYRLRRTRKGGLILTK